MKWFGRKAAREGARPALARVGGGGFGEWPRSYEAQVREGYCQNPVAQRAVKLVAEAVGGAPLLASDPGLAALAEARSGGQPLLETLTAQLLLHGNAYAQVLTDDAGKVGELFALRPERVTVEPDARGWPVAYRYRVGEHVARLAAEDGAGRPAVVHIKAFHPLDDHYGLGCLGAAAGAVALAGAEDVLEAAGALLADSTLALRDAVKAAAPDAEMMLLVYTPTALVQPVANVPAGWASPAFDLLQLEDYDWAAAGNAAASAKGIAAAGARLGYPAARQHYLAGFVLRAEDKGQWRNIAAAAARARRRGVARTFVWALPQVLRDGFVHFDIADEEEDVTPFDDVAFPLALGREAEVAPEVSTAIVTSAGGQEMRNAEWAEARTRYDVGPGVRSEDDIAALLAFFRARMGPARGFRLRDPFDFAAADAPIGTGDGATASFALVKHYGEVVRRITRPVAGTVRVKVDGEDSEAFTLGEGGVVTFDVPPPAGAAVTASFVFDVPVRFAEDRLQVSRATFLAGAAASVPLVEIRE